jgi:hypothetical protein
MSWEWMHDENYKCPKCNNTAVVGFYMDDWNRKECRVRSGDADTTNLLTPIVCEKCKSIMQLENE